MTERPLALGRTCRVFSGTAAALSLLVGANAQFPPRHEVIDVATRVNDRWMANNPSPTALTSNWSGATYMIGALDAYHATANTAYLAYVKAWADFHGYRLFGGDATRHADHQTAGQVYLGLYDLMGDPARLAHIRTNTLAMVNSTSSADWTWCDALHMAMPVFARLGQLDANPGYSAKLYSLYNYCKRSVGGFGLYHAADELWARDATYLSPPASSRVYWSRGNAWVFVAHARVLEILPTSDPRYLEYLSSFRSLAARLRALQQPDGFWYADLTNPSRFPFPETSGTSGFAYGLAWGIRSGALDAATYEPVLLRAWNGLRTQAVRADGFLGYVQRVGKDPRDHQPITVNDTSDFGVGLFLMAAAELSRLSADQVAPPVVSHPPGEYASPLVVTLSTTTAGATIRYRLDGEAPTPTTGTVYTSAIPLATGTNLRAAAFKDGAAGSTVSSASYTFASTSSPGVTVTVTPQGTQASGGGALPGSWTILLAILAASRRLPSGAPC